MTIKYGYIYIRFHSSYDEYNACKLGKTNNIPDRDSQYVTGEIIRGYFPIVFEIHLEKMDTIEKILQDNFIHLHIQLDGGTEFYDKKIIYNIEPFLCKNNIKYRKLSEQEISNLVRCKRITSSDTCAISSTSTQDITGTKKLLLSQFEPREYQSHIIEKSFIHYQNHDKGMLILMCGMGKTLISLWITQKLRVNNIIIGVPNRLLLNHWKEATKNIFPDICSIIVEGDINTENIRNFVETNKSGIVITTYASSKKVYDVTNELQFVFDMKINDEVHHLTSKKFNDDETRKTYVNMLKIPSNKQISLTATLKILENKEKMREEDIVVSNDNVEYFGDIIDKKGLLWAINENIICDYDIQTIITDEEQLEQQLIKFNIIEENDMRLFLAAFASLKSIFDGHSHHLLIYSNNKDNSLKLIQYIKMLLHDNYFDIPDLYYRNYHSEMKPKEQKEIINNFEKEKFGIISCVYCLGEGWDFPLLDGVVFAENMTSNIRIVQSALRASRKNKTEPNKKTKIILPILNRDDWLENIENPDLKKVREVIYQMGLEDETITQKIKVFRINIKKQKPKQREKEENDMVDEFGEYDDELTQKLRLKTTKRTTIGTTYEKARKIIYDKGIKSKKSYYELCERDNRLPEDPEISFKGKFTNWIEYLSIERVYYDLETCKNKVGEYLISYPDIKKHYLELSIVSKELCKIDTLFPPNGLWVEYYNVKDLRDIITITNKKKKIGAIL
jgi:superfamily II DNA or RNA helicase